MSSPYRLDHDKVIVPETDSLLAVIPLSARNVVLSLCEYLNWPAFWRANPPGQLEWDNIQSIIAELEQAMTTAISVQGLLDKMDDQTVAANNQTAAIQSLCECIVASYVANPGTWPIDPPDPNGDYIDILPGMTPPLPTEPSAGNESCLVAADLIDRMIDTLESLAPYASIGSGALVIVSLLLILAIPYAGAYAITAITAAGIWSAIMTFTSSGLLAQASTLRANKQIMVCEVKDWDIWLDSNTQIVDFLQGMKGLFSEHGAPAAETIASFMYTQNTANFIADNLASYTGDCGCTQIDWLNYHLDQEGTDRLYDFNPGVVYPVFEFFNGVQILASNNTVNSAYVGPIPAGTLSGNTRIRYSWWTRFSSHCRGGMRLQRFNGSSWVNVGANIEKFNSYRSLKYTEWLTVSTPLSGDEYRLYLTGGSTGSHTRGLVFVHLELETGLP